MRPEQAIWEAQTPSTVSFSKLLAGIRHDQIPCTTAEDINR